MKDLVCNAHHSHAAVIHMEFTHPYLPLTKEAEQEMLRAIGLHSLDALFSNIPDGVKLKTDLSLPDPHTEIEVARRLQFLSEKNTPANNGRFFIGGGIGMHYSPAAVSALAGRSEFVTAYTSYQSEISQGMLQTLFEYQSLLAELLEIEVVNSSMYDMATAVAEAARMAVRVKKGRSRFLIPKTINPEHRTVIRTYTEPAGITLEEIGYDSVTGLLSLTDLEEHLGDDVAGVYIENPSYLGVVETQVDDISSLVHDAGALLVAGADILSLGVLRPPGDYGADIVVAEGQSLGSPMSFGGPLLGIFGCRMDRRLVYQLPGRLVGMTQTSEKPFQRGFVLTLSPREQHIRREKATSNICSNQALAAVTAAVYLSLLGAAGLKQLSETIAYRSAYAARRFDEIPGVTAPAIGDFFWKEFVVRFPDDLSARHVHDALLKRGLHGGKILTDDFPLLGESMLFCVSELHTMTAIDELVEAVRQISSGKRRND